MHSAKVHNTLYGGYGLTHELLATGGRDLAQRLSGVTPEGDAWRRWGQYIVSDPAADPASHRFLVINTLPWQRHVRWPLPPDMGGAALYGSLEMFLMGNFRERPPLEQDTPGEMVVDAHLPPFGYAVLDYHTLDAAASADTLIGAGTIENRWYRVQLDPATGGLLSWYDKALDRELVNAGTPWKFGQYLYEWIDHPDDRRALFALDFNREDFGLRHTDTPFRRAGASQVDLLPARREADGLYLEARLQAPGANAVKVRYCLPHHEKALHLDLVVDKTFVTRAEAVYIPFPLAFEQPSFHLDLNGVPLQPEADQLPGSCRDWYGIHRWAEINDGTVSVTLVPLDSPLIQVGGITTGRWAHQLDTHQPMLVSWALHNHWDTNFQASQGQDILLRYRLTSQEGYDPAASSRFAMNSTVPPIIVRVPGAETGAQGQFLQVAPEGVAEVHLKRAADGDGLIVHAFNLTAEAQPLAISLPQGSIAAAWRCTPLEANLDALTVSAGGFTLDVPARSVACARLTLA